MCANVVEMLNELDNETAFSYYQKKQEKMVTNLYSFDIYKKKLLSFYKGNYSFY